MLVVLLVSVFLNRFPVDFPFAEKVSLNHDFFRFNGFCRAVVDVLRSQKGVLVPLNKVRSLVVVHPLQSIGLHGIICTYITFIFIDQGLE